MEKREPKCPICGRPVEIGGMCKQDYYFDRYHSMRDHGIFYFASTYLPKAERAMQRASFMTRKASKKRRV